MTRIFDGTGTEHSAKVDKDGKLHVDSVIRSSEGEEAKKGNAFILHAECHLAAAASGGFLYFTNNEPDYDIVVTRIYIDAGTLTTGVKVRQIKNPATVSNGTDISATGIIQKNFESHITLDASLVVSDGASDMTYTGGEQYHAFSLSTLQSQQRNMNETNIIGPGKTMLFGWSALTGSCTNAETVSFSINVIKRLRTQ